jgi:internalin A
MTHAEGIRIARERISKELAEQTGFLDLGGLGLEDLPEELATLKHLKSLNLGSAWIDSEGEIRSREYEGDDANRLNDASGSILDQLPNLVSLFADDCGLSGLGIPTQACGLTHLWIGSDPIDDLSPLASLPALQSLDCSGTQVSDLSPLASLVALQSLDCHDTQVSDLSPLASLPALQSLNCFGTHVSDLAPLAKLRALQSLDCSYTEVCDLGPLAKLPALQSLDCLDTQVSDLSPLEKLPALQSLDCRNTQVSDLSPLAKLTTLQSLQCGGTQVSDLAPLAKLTALQSLDCSNTEVKDLAPLAKLTALQSLDCFQTKVSALSQLAKLTALQSLSCSFTQVSDLVPLAKLPSLQTLDCRDTQVSDLAPLAKLPALQWLQCCDTQVSNLAPLAKLPALQSLECSKTKVRDLAPLANLSTLQRFRCSDTQVSDLAPLAKLTALQSLDCSNTEVKDLAPLAKLPALQSLDCSNTKVRDLAPLANLPALESLDCRETQVSDLAPLANLPALESLDCRETQVSDLGVLAKVPKLAKIWASGVPINHLPEELVFSPCLRKLCIHDVPATAIPAEILSTHGGNSCLERLRSHLADSRAGSAALPDVKVMVLGNGRVGKTQICRRLRGESYEAEADSTHGITVTTTPFNGRHEGLDEIMLHLWDFGGQDIYHGTHALFMRSRAVFFVVWTPDTERRDEHEYRGLRFRNHRLDYWLEMVSRSGGDGSPVLLIQTRCDTVADELRQPPAPDALLNRFGFCKVLHYSAREDRGRAALDEAIGDAIGWTRQHQGNAMIGIGRLKVRRRLEKLRDDDAKLPAPDRRHRVISNDFFVGICVEEGGVSNPGHLLAYLHECGVVFHRPEIFGGEIVLDQEWALEAIYTLFNREKSWRQLRRLKGRFTRSLLATLAWQEYDEREQALFIELMKSAGICFVHREGDARSHTETEYIAPDLLPDLQEVGEELAAFWQNELTEERTLEFPFEYPGLVRGIIARVGQAAGMNAVYWKSGVCGYDRRTRSAIRIDTLPPADGNPYGLRLQVRTQRGRTKELLDQALEWIREETRNGGCQVPVPEAAESPPPLRLPRGPSRGEPDGVEKEPLAREPDFGPPPRKAAKTYCVSYAWTTESSGFVDQLCADAEACAIEVIRDKTHLGLGERISKFMNRLGIGDRIFVILSEKYLKSPFCMFELFEIWRQSRREESDFLKRVRVFRLPDAGIATLKERVKVGVYWKTEFEEVDALLREHGPSVMGADDFARYKLMKDFALHVGDILGLVMDTLQPQTLEEFERFSFELPE